MKTEIFIQESRVSATPREVYDWHQRPYAFDRVMPPWENTRADVHRHVFRDGLKVGFYFDLGPIRFDWRARYEGVIDGVQFVDVQEKGPFPLWRHTHRFDPDGAGGCIVRDRVEYALPAGRLGRIVAGNYARERLVRMFDHRHAVMREEFDGSPRERPMKIAITGATGLVGRELVAFLSTRGHAVVRLVRDAAAQAEGDVVWSPARGELDPESLRGVAAVVHLAGESVVGRWTARKKRAVIDSRRRSTDVLVRAIRAMPDPPRVFIGASAIGYYGDHGEAPIDETVGPGAGFLPDVCVDWEARARPLREVGVRVAHARIGVVLSPRGGALRTMLPPFRLGLGGPMGDGRQFMSWVSMPDTVGLLHHALVNEAIDGPFNAVAPGAVPNREFSGTLARVLRRPAFLPAPAFALRAAMGELADGLLLASLRVVPRRALETGYRFRHAELESALRAALGIGNPASGGRPAGSPSPA